MPNLSVNPLPPVTAMQSFTSSDTGSVTPGSEPFGNVLARQRSNVSLNNSKHQTNNQQAKSPSAANDTSGNSANAVTKEDNVISQPAAVLDSAVLAAYMLTALLPASVPSNNADTKISGSESKDQPDSQVALPGGVNPIPVDLLALVVPAVAADASGMQQNAKGNQEPLKPVESSPVVQTSAISGLNSTAQLIATEGLNSATQSAAIEGLAATELNKKVMPPDTNPLQVETITSGAQNAALAPSAEKTVPKGGIVPADLNLTPDGLKENSFASAMASIGKEAANSENLATVAAAKLASAATGSHSQQVESATDNSLMQSGMMAASPSQNVGLQSAQTVIKTPVTDRAWANEFNQKVTWMATRQEQTAELHLNPPHLGPLDVVLKVSGDQATALFTSPHAAVREAVEQALPQLRNMLAENGITLGNAMVNDQSPKDRQAWQAGQQQKEKGSTVGSIETTHSSAGNLSNSGTSPSSRHQGMVDTFA